MYKKMSDKHIGVLLKGIFLAGGSFTIALVLGEKIRNEIFASYAIKFLTYSSSVTALYKSIKRLGVR